MPSFGKQSKDRLDTCHPTLRAVFTTVIRFIDCAIIDGYRTKERQTIYFQEGKSRVQWPNGKHNKVPSLAVDVVPYVNGAVSWKKEHCIYLAGVVMGVSAEMGVPVRWGGNWDMDGEVITDQSFQDLVHYEIVEV